jgi:yersiniabactin nonribosomal peptide synthetase
MIDDMRRQVAAALGVEPPAVRDTDDLLRLGLDSIAVMRLAARWQHEGAAVTFADLAERRTLADWWSLVAAGKTTEPAEVQQVDDAEPFELAPLQHAYWVGRADGQAVGGVGAHFYNEFDGRDVDPARLETAVRALIARHGMLRARFTDDGRQYIQPESPWPGLRVHDLRDASEVDIARLRDQLSHRRLDVDAGEVFDVRLSLLPDGTCRTHVHIEMLVADAHSFRVLLADLAALYQGRGHELPPINTNYPSYRATKTARGEQNRLRAKEYWTARLADLPLGPRLPLAVDPDQISGHRTVRRHHRLAANDWRRLTERCREHGVTLSMALATAFAEVLGAWSDEPRFLLNFPLYDREPVHPDVPLLCGDFTNLLLLEVDVSTRQTFAERVTAVQTRFQADVAHSAYSGADVLRDLARTRADRTVSAPVVFTGAIGLGELFDEGVRDCFGTPGWTMSQTPQVWLDHQVTEREGGLYLNWDVVDGLLRPGVLDAMFVAYTGLLDHLLDGDWNVPAPDPLPASQAEKRRQVNDTAGDTGPTTLHETFFARAAAKPDAPALLWHDDERLTYGELADRARSVAGALAQHGIGRGDTVAILLPKGPDQVAAVLGVLTLGAAYVPIGVEQPPARRARILEGAGVLVALTAPDAEAVEGVETLPVNKAYAAEPLPRPEVQPGEDTAYLIYTSGSTGEPKGVEVPHRAAANTVADLNERFAVGPGDRVLAVSALDFDLSVYDIFGVLSSGGAVVLIDQESRRDAARWAELVRTHRVTIWQSVPALLDMLLVAGEEHGLGDSLRIALLGGDWVGVDLPGRLVAQCPEARLVALGGTTETAIHSTVIEVGDVPAHWRSVPYGVPLRNQLCRVADGLGRDRPDWVTGELWIGGRGVAHGYCGDPARTADRFTERDGVRWYRTGDLARYWPDGTLEFLGRGDFQVKVRGHRIELGEVEAALAEHPAVTRAVAVTVGAPPTVRLAAAVIGAASQEELRDLLTARLPGYMVPDQILVLDQLPLSANGKLDRRAISTLCGEHTAAAVLEPPAGPVETAVAEVWAELLSHEEVGRNQNFFALGGDSLLATRLLAKLRGAGVRGAQLRTLFAKPVLADFAAGLHLGRADEQREITPDPANRFEPFPATDVQRAYWLGRGDEFALGGVGSHWYWEFDGTGVDVERLEEAFNILVTRHDMLRAVFDPDGRQRVLPEVPRFTIPVTDSGLDALRNDLAYRIPDPATWPLVEIRGVRHGNGRTRLGFSFDFIVLDALSIVTVFAELSRLYEDLAAPLPPVGITFRDYLVGDPIPADEITQARAYWSARVDDLPPAPQLPLRVDPATVTAPRFTRRTGSLTASQWTALTHRARAHGLTPATVLACAYAEVLAAWSERDELTLNLTLFDRRRVHPDIDRVLGDFTSLLLVAHEPSEDRTWLGTARRFQERVWSDMEHSAVSALWVLREAARRSGTAAPAMPVVFTSALGLSEELVNLEFPFGQQCWGISQTPQVWLDNQVMERGGELSYSWDAVDELFCDGVLDAMFDAYTRVLAHLADHDWAAPLPILLPPGQLRVRERVNDTAGPVPAGLLTDGFFAWAAREPNRVALLHDGQVTYGELADQALRVAGQLVRDGVRPGDPVAVTLPKGPEQIAAVLGVLAAGAVYVPIGVDQPTERRDRIHQSAGVVAVITGATQAPPLSESVVVDPDSLAYVIYTSGSTGEPKGVQITHAAALNTITDITERFGVGPEDRVLAVSALDFDLSVYDIFGLLGAGGAIVLVDEGDRREAGRWVELVRRHGVTVWNSVPALLDMALVAGLGEPLRLALVSGDWVGLDLPGRLAAACPGARFVALGGATEVSIWSNALEVAEVPAHWRSVPYGFPLRNQSYRVADGRGRDRPDWVPGELWIGGLGVARGYRGDPERTARQFVEHDDGTWYRTGDLGRYWPDGTLEFLGRQDFQVKVRGHRIELGEIEAALEAHPAVTGAVATTVGNGLAAAVRGTCDPDDLRVHLTELLPAYMVPDQYLVLDEFPLSANGKVDRKAIAARFAGSVGGTHAGAPLTSEREGTVAALWHEVLGVAVSGRGDNFFALGGDSLLATRLLADIRSRLGIELQLRELLGAPTVAELAALLDAREDELMDEGVL